MTKRFIIIATKHKRQVEIDEKTLSTLCLQTLKVAIIPTDEVPTQHNEPESKQDGFDYYQEDADISQRNVEQIGISFCIYEKFYLVIVLQVFVN